MKFEYNTTYKSIVYHNYAAYICVHVTMLLSGMISFIFEARFVGSANQKDPPILMVRPQGTSNPPNDHILMFVQHVLERQNVASSSLKLNCLS